MATVRERAQTLTKKQLLELYRQMVLIRRFEEKSAEMYGRAKIGGFLHLYIGEEAVAVGAISVLEPQDCIVSHYREHGHALARGMHPNVVMAELFGKVTGCSRGKGGSMHLFDASLGFYGGTAIVGGGMPISVGLGLASKMREGNRRVTLSFFGDAAVNQGEFHESLNLATLWKLPVVFACENNGYGMGTAVERTFAVQEIYRLAERYGIPSEQVDGMDVLAVRDRAQAAVARARAGEGPSFLEIMTYRYMGHSMADPVSYRHRSEVEEWRKRDCIDGLKRKLLTEGLATEADLAALDAEVDRAVEEAVRFADESPFPPPEELYADVYSPRREDAPSV
ncbi:MAG: pyruvate dehydrogenase (acetyl-transferring) E1 component subunit alpha [Chloroflexi bacterium]|nr:pyruvate dehydrogenase (acetyl-transferring) E1 component subunit alpha [Chloroflexota bacterium]